MRSRLGPQAPGETPEPATLPSDPQRERWSRVKAVFVEALEHEGSERRAFLDRACAGADELRREVESQLESDRAASSFCENPAAWMLATEDGQPVPAPRLAPGTHLGSYVIERFLAAGGMGEVYAARHVVLNREVAIKTVS